MRVFFERASDRVVAGFLDNVQLDDLLFEQAQRPSGVAFWSRPTGQRDEFRFRGAIENSGPRGLRIVFVRQRGVEPFVHELAPRPFNCGDAGIQRLGDPAITPAFASLRDIRLQQDTRLGQQSRGSPARADECGKPIPFLGAQTHDVFFNGDFFPGHESSPSLINRNRDSQLTTEINDGGH